MKCKRLLEMGGSSDYDTLLFRVKSELKREPLTKSELASITGEELYTVKNRLDHLISDGTVSVSGEGKGKTQYYFIKGMNYKIFNPLTEGKCPTLYAKELLKALSKGPLWLPLLHSEKYKSLWNAAETLAESGVLERIEYFVSDYETRFRKPTANTKTQTLLYAIPGYNNSQLEKAILDVEKSRSKGMSVALDFIGRNEAFTPEQLGDAAGISRQGTDRIAGHLVEMGLIKKYAVCNNRIIYAGALMPELSVMESAAINYLKYAGEVIKVSRVHPFITSEVMDLFRDTEAPEAYCSSVCKRLEDRYGVLEHVCVYINGVGKRDLFYRTGTSQGEINKYVSKLRARTMSGMELVKSKLEEKEPFTISQASRELRLSKRGVSYGLKQNEGLYTVSRSPVYFIIPDGSSQKDIDGFVESKTKNSGIDEAINDLIIKREAFTLNDLLEDFAQNNTVGVLNNLVSKGELSIFDYVNEDVYVSKSLDYSRVMKRIVENGLDFKKEWKIKAYYFLNSRDRTEICREFNEPIERVNELLPLEFDSKKIYLLDFSGYSSIRPQVELRFKYSSGINSVRYESTNRPFFGSYLIVSAPVGFNAIGLFNKTPGVKTNVTVQDESYFRGFEFNDILVKKFDLVQKMIECLGCRD